MEPIRRVLPALSLDVHQQDARGQFLVRSTGTWPTGDALPVAFVIRDDGQAFGWQTESSAAWMWALSQHQDGAAVVLSGPTYADHHFAVALAPEAMFTTEPITVVTSLHGRET